MNNYGRMNRFGKAGAEAERLRQANLRKENHNTCVHSKARKKRKKKEHELKGMRKNRHEVETNLHAGNGVYVSWEARRDKEGGWTRKDGGWAGSSVYAATVYDS